MRLNEISYLPNEEVAYRHLHPFCEIFADRFVVCKDCPTELMEEVKVYCQMRNKRSNDSVCRAYRAGLLP